MMDSIRHNFALLRFAAGTAQGRTFIVRTK